MSGEADNCFRFGAFVLDPADRQLRGANGTIELNARYFDALALLVSQCGRLVSKDRFHEQVWRGIPVTDEALTQCIRTLRRQLGDDAVRPRFIETVPKHGYRFIAEVTGGPEHVARAAATRLALHPWQQAALLGAAGTAGAGLAGLIGGLFYGFAGASQPLAPGMGAVSLLLVLVCVSIVVAIVGGAGAAFGIAAARLSSRGCFATIMGGAVGGLVVGALVKLLGLDAFSLLLGRSPGDITGAPEGLVLGAAVGLGAWLAERLEEERASPRQGVTVAALIGAAAGAVIPLAGGRMLGGSLALLAQTFPGSRLRLGQLGALLGEREFGPLSQAVTGALEGLLFAGGIVGAMLLARRRIGQPG